jgi:hypothetical protein
MSVMGERMMLLFHRVNVKVKVSRYKPDVALGVSGG